MRKMRVSFVRKRLSSENSDSLDCWLTPGLFLSFDVLTFLFRFSLFNFGNRFANVVELRIFYQFDSLRKLIPEIKQGGRDGRLGRLPNTGHP